MTRRVSDRHAEDDPFVVLGLDRHAGLDEVRAARRRLAFELHPDRGGDLAEMQRLNAAFERCVAHATGRRPLLDPSVDEPIADHAVDIDRERSWNKQTGTRAADSWRRGPRRVEHDVPSFTVDALPAETFEALLVVLSWIGEVLDDDPPYMLECHLTEPAPCWCRLEIVPDAGASTVSLTVVSPADGQPVTADTVRDVWVEHLNRLGRPTP